MTDMTILASFHRVLVEEIRRQRPEYLTGPFTVAEIYQNLVPYGTHRDRIGVEMNGDYEDALLRLLAGEGGYVVIESDAALRNLREELESVNPNTGLYREYAAVDVRLNPQFVDGRSADPDPFDFEEDAVSMDDLAPAPEAAPAKTAAPVAAAPAPSEPPRPSAAGVSAQSAAQATCRWCRAELPERENMNFCPFCGTDVHVVPCSACGEELEPDWRFCLACGAEVAG